MYNRRLRVYVIKKKNQTEDLGYSNSNVYLKKHYFFFSKRSDERIRSRYWLFSTDSNAMLRYRLDYILYLEHIFRIVFEVLATRHWSACPVATAWNNRDTDKYEVHSLFHAYNWNVSNRTFATIDIGNNGLRLIVTCTWNMSSLHEI